MAPYPAYMTWSQSGPAVGSHAGGQRERSRRVRRSAAALGTALIVLPAIAGCGAFGGLPVPTPSAPEPSAIATAEMMPSASPTSTAAPAATTPGVAGATSSGGQQGVATMTGGNGMGRKLILGAGAVPAGWTDSTPRETGGYRMTICGVDLEPSAPIDGAQKRWQNTPSGPFLEQHVRVYADRTAANVVSALAQAVPACRGYTAVDASGGSASYVVEKLTVPGADSGFVTWRQRLTLPAPQPATTPTDPSASAPPAASPAPVLIQDVAVTKRGTSVILLASYAVDTPPQPQVLATAVRAVGPSK